MQENTNIICEWIEERRRRSNLKVKSINLILLADWSKSKGSIKHDSGHFFSIVGAAADMGYEKRATVSQPLIDQPEIGILGFIFCKTKKGIEILIQAKTEPGNIGGTQIAPTVQATESNYLRIHHGKPTRFINHFVANDKLTIEGSLQSEQETRFLGKYNRNASIFLNSKHDLIDPIGDCWQWFPLNDILQLLDRNYLINTDARSVLICSDWTKLVVQRQPFEQKDEFANKLFNSLQTAGKKTYWLKVLQELRERYKFKVKIQPLDELDSWHQSDDKIFQKNGFMVNYYHVSATDREVKEWSQPFIQSYSDGKVVLYCQLQEGILHFLVSPSIEIGLKECVQFGPSLNVVDNKSTYSFVEVPEKKIKSHR